MRPLGMDEPASAPTHRGAGPRLTPAALCCYVHQADYRGRTVGTTTFTANHTTEQVSTGQSHARQGGGPSHGFFARGSGRLKKITKQSQLEYKPSDFNNLTNNR